MRIAISCHPTQGGSGVVASELAMALAQRGHQVHVVCVERPFRLSEGSGVHFHPVTIADYPLFRWPPHDLCLANKLAELVLEHDIQILHAHYVVPHAISAILAAHSVRPQPVRVVSTLHGTDITLVGSHSDFYRICRYAMEACDGLTSVSDWLCAQTMHTFSLSKAPKVIPNFVDPLRFHPEGHVGFPAGDEPFTILHASNFRPVKRVCDVVRSFDRVRRTLEARLVMVGDGPEVGLAEELAAQLGLEGLVTFVGPQVKMEDIYRRSHLFILPSEYESFGLAALEAQACGVPVVASRAGGLLEVVRDGETGHLCPVGEVETIAARAVELLSDREVWERTSAAAAAWVRERFSLERVVGCYEAFYEEVVGGVRLEA